MDARLICYYHITAMGESNDEMKIEESNKQSYRSPKGHF